MSTVCDGAIVTCDAGFELAMVMTLRNYNRFNEGSLKKITSALLTDVRWQHSRNTSSVASVLRLQYPPLSAQTLPSFLMTVANKMAFSHRIF